MRGCPAPAAPAPWWTTCRGRMPTRSVPWQPAAPKRAQRQRQCRTCMASLPAGGALQGGTARGDSSRSPGLSSDG